MHLGFHGKTFAAAMAAALIASGGAWGRKLEVGPGKTYATPCAAAPATQAGDTVEIAAGTYSADVCIWSKDSLVLRGTSKYAHLKADGAYAQGKGTWVITGKNVKVENIEFSGAKVPDENGAGIRSEGAGLTISHCYFHDNENGILSGGANGEILIEYTEFANNGYGDGQSHNMYIGSVPSFVLRYCYTHHARIGHNIKSRAHKNKILYNLSIGGTDGTESYELDLPNGGETFVIGNVFQQAQTTDNATLFAYAAEGMTNPNSALYVINNTFVNDRSNGTFISVGGSPATSKVINNFFVGNGTLVAGKADTAANLRSASPGFVDRAAYDYRLTPASPAVDKGIDPGTAAGMGLAPAFQYLHPAGGKDRPVKGALDLGAFELEDGVGIRKRPATGKGRTDGKPGAAGTKAVFPGPAGGGPEWVDALGKLQG